MITKNNKLLLGILAFIVTLTIGYAVFTQSVTVTGTATANGTFNMQITSATVIEQAGSSGATVSISGDKQTMSINIPKLEYPGAYVIIDYIIKNNGTINSLFTGIETIGADYNLTPSSTKAIRIQPAVKDNVTYSTSSSTAFNGGVFSKYYFEPTDSVNHRMAIYWKSSENITSTESANITVSFKFEQVVDEENACERLTEIRDELVANRTSLSTQSSTQKTIYDIDFNGRITADDISKITYIINQICPSS